MYRNVKDYKVVYCLLPKMYSLTGIDSGKKIAYIGLGLTHFVYSINQSITFYCRHKAHSKT